jgi:hypothetical protein
VANLQIRIKTRRKKEKGRKKQKLKIENQKSKIIGAVQVAEGHQPEGPIRLVFVYSVNLASTKYYCDGTPENPI